MSNEVIIDDDESKDCEYVVCSRISDPLLMPDNVIGTCCKCGNQIQHRPHIPTGPPTVCVPCILPEMEAEARKGELGIVITTESAKELAAHLEKKRMH